MMMKIFNGMATMVGIWILFYCLGSFVAADFNIANWSAEGRGLLGILGGGIGAVCGFMVSVDAFNILIPD